MKRFWHAVLLLLAFFLVSLTIASLLELKGLDINAKIIVLPINGEISFDKQDGFFSLGFSADNAIQKLDALNKDTSVKGVILEIDSPGGSVVASKQLADKVKSMNKPIIALVKESAASGAYWVASSSDLIVADEMSIIGSVGVIGSYLQFSELMDKYGVEYERLVAGDVKDLGSPYKALTKEEKELLQSRINDIQKYFLNDVTNSRGLSKESVKKISDGSFYLGIEAKQLGLIDEFGNIDVAFNETKRLANVTDAKLQFMQQKPNLAAALSQFASKSSYVLGQGIGDSLKTLGKQELLSV